MVFFVSTPKDCKNEEIPKKTRLIWCRWTKRRKKQFVLKSVHTLSNRVSSHNSKSNRSIRSETKCRISVCVCVSIHVIIRYTNSWYIYQNRHDHPRPPHVLYLINMQKSDVQRIWSFLAAVSLTSWLVRLTL